MSLRFGPLAALLLVLAGLAVVRAEAPPAGARQWLERMIHAAHNLTYEGTFVYVQGQQLEAMRIIHRGGDSQRQRMFSLSGSPREVVVKDDQVICRGPDHAPLPGLSGYRRSPFLALPRELDTLERYYQFEVQGEDRVVGRNTRIVAIQPRDKLRYGYRLWLEQDSGMLLRSVLLDEAGQPLEQLMFTSLELKPEVDPALLEPAAPTSASPVPPAAGSPDADKLPNADKPPAVDKPLPAEWTLSALPPGFSEVTHNRLKVHAGPHPAEHIVLTDGLATVSVFLEPLIGGKPLLTGPAHMGAMHAFGAVVDGHQVLVVGEVPVATAQQIAAAVQRIQAAK
jgi:sigma-E factor negative regulatory protein RseB